MNAPSSRDIKCTICGIQHFSLHNGPGLRTAIFFKGCPLRCAWCCNPEAYSMQIGLSYDAERCIGLESCGLCLKTCPQQAIYSINNKSIGIARDLCTNCGACAGVCPSEALFMNGKSMSIEEILRHIGLDEAYIRNGGGITLSGGEPFMRPQGAAAILKAAQLRGLHTLVETCGFFDMDDPAVRQALQATDMLFYDIKHTDPIRHKQGTELENARILQNLSRIGKDYPSLKLVTRTPVVPGFNDTMAEMTNIARIVGSLSTVEWHELSACIPYCENKYAQLGIPCLYTFAGRPSPQKMRDFAEIFEQAGIKVRMA